MRKVNYYINNIISTLSSNKFLFIFASFIAVTVTIYSFFHGYIISYGDAESHLNIAKRIVTSLTPGFSQLGGIWLPLPHLLMVPLVYFNPLWRTGLAGSIISGISYVISCYVVYRLVLRITNNKFAAIVGYFAFALNPNILYMQSTPLTELPLICFFLLSIYFFTIFLDDKTQFMYLIFSAFFGFCASLSRYDGWALVSIEFVILLFFLATRRFEKRQWIGKIILFSTLAFFGILIWIAWDALILGDPFYFSDSAFSAKSQQQGWLARGELPSYHNIFSSISYYFVVSANNIGIILASVVCLGFIIFLLKTHNLKRFFPVLLLLSPFIFYVYTLYSGQSVIFTPELTPITFEWRTFNVRYGIMMIPFAAFIIGFLASLRNAVVKSILFGLIILQFVIFATGKESVVTLADGTG